MGGLAREDDLARLNRFDEPSVLDLLETRYSHNDIYTWVNAMIVAINPYREPVGLYGQDMLLTHDRFGEEQAAAPHVFGVASAAFKGMLAAQSQSILVTGESGAGKTETCRRVLQYLAHAGAKARCAGDAAAATTDGRRSGSLYDELTRSNCVLEAFGNARTTMNDNSSRFGKFLALRYSAGTLASAAVNTYLLEKTRVVAHASGERTFHILYSLVDGLTQSQAREILPAAGTAPADAAAFRYTSGGGWPAPASAEPTSVAIPLSEVAAALARLGITAVEAHRAWRALGGVLAVGNVSFVGGEAAEVAPASDRALRSVAGLLGVGEESLRQVLVTRCIQAGSEFITTPTTAETAASLRDGLAKALYHRLFCHLVARLNASLAATHNGASAGSRGERFIGLLDIFGFEIFETNSLEQVPTAAHRAELTEVDGLSPPTPAHVRLKQAARNSRHAVGRSPAARRPPQLLINYTNEQMQALFNEVIFVAAQQENEAEGLPAVPFDEESVGNKDVVRLLGAPRSGLFALLDEECVFPKGSAASFLAKWRGANKECARLMPTRQAHVSTAELSRVARAEVPFAVSHYAGLVRYDAADFLVKNKDPLSEDQQILLRESTEPLIADLFTPAKKLAGQRGRGGFKGVVSKFATELDGLLSLVCSSQVRFVRCIKPNLAKQPASFERDTVLRQLRCGGVLEAVRVYSSGFPDRLPLAEFVGRFAPIVPSRSRPTDAELQLCHRDAARLQPTAEGMLSSLGFSSNEFAVGRTKLFLRPGVASRLQALREGHVLTRVTACQAALRGALARARTRSLRTEARHEREQREREAARAREVEALRLAQEAEVAAARAAAEAKAARLAAVAEEEARRERRQREERAAAEAAAAAARAEEMKTLRAAIAAEAGQREAAERQLDHMATRLEESESARFALASELEAAAAAAAAASRQDAAEVERWRGESALAAQQLAHAQEELAMQGSHARLRSAELREELSLYKERFRELVLQVTSSPSSPAAKPPRRAPKQSNAGGGGFFDSIFGAVSSVTAGVTAGASSAKRSSLQAVREPAAAAHSPGPTDVKDGRKGSLKDLRDFKDGLKGSFKDGVSQVRRDLKDGYMAVTGQLAPDDAGPAVGGAERPPFVPPISGISRAISSDLAARDLADMSPEEIGEELEPCTPRLRQTSAEVAFGGGAGSGTSAGSGGALVEEYAAYLGLRAQTDPELMWIAEEAAAAPLPDGWAVRRDPKGRLYYWNEATEESSRVHPRDAEFSELVQRAKLERARAAATPSAGNWSTMQMRSLEQTLCAATDEPMQAVVSLARPAAGQMATSLEYLFDVTLDSRSKLSGFRATYHRGAALPTYAIALQSGKEDARQQLVRVLGRGKYDLVRPPKPSGAAAALALAAATFAFAPSVLRQSDTSWDSLAATLITQPVAGVHLFELLLPQPRGGRPPSRAHPSSASGDAAAKGGSAATAMRRCGGSGLVGAYEAGDTEGLIVFVGAVEIGTCGAAVTLSLPKTSSANLALEACPNGTVKLRYAPPISAVAAFHAALTFAHWLENTYTPGVGRARGRRNPSH